MNATQPCYLFGRKCRVNYEVATISRLLKITGLFCKRALLKRLYSAKETRNFKEPFNRSHPIVLMCLQRVCVIYTCVVYMCSI